MAIPHAIVSAINQRPTSSAPPQKCTIVFTRASRICFPVQETLKSEAKKKAHHAEKLFFHSLRSANRSGIAPWPQHANSIVTRISDVHVACGVCSDGNRVT